MASPRRGRPAAPVESEPISFTTWAVPTACAPRYPLPALTDPRPTSTSPWRLILAPESAERVLQVVREIAADLQSRIASSSLGVSPGLAGGESGLALFFSYLDRARPGEGYDDIAMEMLERTILATAENPLMPSLYSGISGVAWTMEHLSGRL